MCWVDVGRGVGAAGAGGGCVLGCYPVQDHDREEDWKEGLVFETRGRGREDSTVCVAAHEANPCCFSMEDHQDGKVAEHVDVSTPDFVLEGVVAYTTLEVSVPQLPMKERSAIVRSLELGLFL